MPDRIANRAVHYIEPIGVAAVLLGLYLAGLFSFLLFFSLTKALIILLSFSIFVFAWNTRRLQEEIFLLIIGYGSLSSAVLYLFYSLTDGVSLFPQLGINLSPQFLFGSMAVKSIALLAASLFLGRKGSSVKTGAVFAGVTALLVGATFLPLFPPSYTDAGKPTAFMHAGGIGIALLDLASIINLLGKEQFFNHRAHQLLITALLASAIAALLSAYDEIGADASDIVRNCVRLLSWYLLYRAVILSGFDEPLARQSRTLRLKEEELRESEGRFRAIYERSPVGIALLDSLTGRFLQVNPKYCAITGYAEEELVLLGFQDITHAEDLQSDLDNMEKLQEGTTRFFTMEKRYVRKDRAVVWVHLTVVPMGEEPWVAGRGPRQHLAMVEDITARRMAEQALLENQAMFRRLVDSNIIGIITVDEEKVLVANDIFLAMTGYSRADLEQGKLLWRNMTPPEYADQDKHKVQELLTEGSCSPYEKEYLRRDGNRVPVLIGSALIRKSPLLRISFVLDLSERKQAEREREAMLSTVDRMRIVAEQRADELAAIFSTLKEPVIIYGADGDELRANPAAFELHGLYPRLFMGTGDDGTLRRLGGNRASSERAPALRALNGEIVVNELFSVIDRDGHEVIGHVSAGPFYSKGVLRGAVVAWHDITELERTKAALQQAYDALDERVRERTAELATANRLLQAEIEDRTEAEEDLRKSRQLMRELALHLQSVLEREREGIAREIHDELGQSLTAIKLDLSWLHDKYADQSGLLKKIDSMIHLIDMSITSVKRIASELRPAILDHLGLSAAVEWQMKEFNARTGIDCRLSITPDDLMVDRDRSTALFRILQEALTNVIRHAEASEVLIALRKTEGQITLQIQDNGKGITQEQRADHRAFGLMGIRERVLFFNGDVDIHSGESTPGTSITIRIPLDEKTAAS